MHLDELLHSREEHAHVRRVSAAQAYGTDAQDADTSVRGDGRVRGAEGAQHHHCDERED